MCEKSPLTKRIIWQLSQILADAGIRPLTIWYIPFGKLQIHVSYEKVGTQIRYYVVLCYEYGSYLCGIMESEIIWSWTDNLVDESDMDISMFPREEFIKRVRKELNIVVAEEVDLKM